MTDQTAIPQPPEPEPECCANCKFWGASEECRRYPPEVFQTLDPMSKVRAPEYYYPSVQPNVSGYDWCGEWRAK